MLPRAAWLAVPCVLGVLALNTGYLPAKLGVPLSCALVLRWAAGQCCPGWAGVAPVVAAFLLSAAGDAFLSCRAGRESWFLAGIVLFFGAHLGYLAFAWQRGRLQRTVLAALCCVFLPYYVFWLRPSIASSALALAVLGYLLISCVVWSAACGLRLPWRVKWPYVAGIGLLVFSDTLISFSEFLGWRHANALILPTYYLAHVGVSWTVLGEVARARTDRDPQTVGG